jgi:protein-S-isoprenylcysteine O-methyltransferase Ste14
MIQMKKLNALGIGPKIGMIAIPWLLITLFLSLYYKELFCFVPKCDRTWFILGIILLVIGLMFYAITVRLLLKGIKNTTLMTSGTYYLCQSPLYAAMILMIIPGIALMLHSWLMLTTCIVAYIMFKINIKSEYREMEAFFGEAYLKYKKDTPEIFPLPVKKWFGNG